MSNRTTGFPFATPSAGTRSFNMSGFGAIFLMALLFTAAARHSAAAEEPATSQRVSCFVSIIPQAFFASTIGGEYVDVHVMVGPGQSPHTYEPTGRQLAELAGSRLYFSIGVAFEASLLPRIERNFKQMKIVDTSAGIALRRMVDYDGDAVGPGTALPPGGPDSGSRSHDTVGLDPHVWLSPRRGVVIARNIRDALVEIDPTHAKIYAEHFGELETELSNLDAEISRLLSPYKGREFFVFHPAYGYFADDYGLVQVAIEAEGGAPGPKHLAELIDRARAQHASVIFVQPQTSASYAETVAKAIGARVVSLDPLAMNYTDNLLDMAKKLAKSYERR